MLKALRNQKTKKNIFIVLAVVVVISFVISGVLINQDDEKTSGSLGLIGKKPVTVQQYLNSYRAVERQASFQFGDKLSEMRSRINFRGEAWDRLLLLDYAHKQNIRVTDAEVVQWLSTQPAFQSKGKFDDQLYSLYIERAMRSTPRDFEEQIRQMLTIAKVQETVKSGSVLSDDKLKELYMTEKAEKDLIYAILPWESFADKVTVTDKEIEQLYEIVKGQLTTPDKPEQPLNLEESQAELKKMIAKQSATELAVKKLSELKDKMKSEGFEAALKSEGLATATLPKYRGGATPAGIDPVANLQNASSSLKEGEISDVFMVSKGAMVVQAGKVYPFDEKKFEEEREVFRNERSEAMLNDAMNELLENLRKNLSLNLEKMKAIFPEEAPSA